MKKILVLSSIFFTGGASVWAQNDTTLIKNRKGFLILANKNFQYDWGEHEIRSLGFHDFFYPSEYLDPRVFLDSSLDAALHNGIRVDYIEGRKELKRKALEIQCTDYSQCYPFDRFYAIPVKMTYKVFEDYEPFVCGRSYFELQVLHGSKIRFEYLHRDYYKKCVS